MERTAERRRIPVIGQSRPLGAPMVLKYDQTRSVMIAAAQIEFRSAGAYGVLNRSPKQQHHSAERIESRIGTAVLIGDGILERQRDDAGDGRIPQRQHFDLQSLSQTVGQIPEPRKRLRWNLMTAARQQE